MPGSIKALRLHNLLLGGGLTGSQLETELGNTLAAGAFEASLRQRAVTNALKASSTALSITLASATAFGACLRQDLTVLDAIFASSSALAALAGNTAAINVIAANSGALAKLVASTPAMTAFAGNSVAKMALYNSSPALTAIAASATAMAALRASAQYSVKTATENGTNAVALGWTGTYIVLGASRSSTTDRNVTVATVRAGSGISGVIDTDTTADTSAMDTNVAIPLSSATSFALDGTGTGTIYFGALRCDV